MSEPDFMPLPNSVGLWWYEHSNETVWVEFGFGQGVARIEGYYHAVTQLKPGWWARAIKPVKPT